MFQRFEWGVFFKFQVYITAHPHALLTRVAVSKIVNSNYSHLPESREHLRILFINTIPSPCNLITATNNL